MTREAKNGESGAPSRGGAYRQGRNQSGENEREPSVKERLEEVLNKPREKLEIEEELKPEKDEEIEQDRDIDRGPAHGL